MEIKKPDTFVGKDGQPVCPKPISDDVAAVVRDSRNKPSADQIARWKEQHGKVYTAKSDGCIAYFRKPTRTELSYMLAMQNNVVTSAEGIIDDDVDQSIRNLTAIGSRGMDETDRYVLDIMTHKGN